MYSFIKTKKILLFFLTISLFFIVTPVVASVTPAVTETPNTYIIPKQLIPQDFFASFLESLEPALIGSYDQEGRLIKPGILDSFDNVIVSLYSPNIVNTKEYAQDIGKDLGLVKPAYAQITGYQHLEGVMGIWKITRDVSYVLFIIVFVA